MVYQWGKNPMQISELFSGHLPDNIDAAFQWGGNEDLYFFKGSQYWKYDTRPQASGYMVAGYPKDISAWRGIPADLDTAFQWKNGKTYFFKSGQYWKFNDREVAVERAGPSYPRNAGKRWFGCQ